MRGVIFPGLRAARSYVPATAAFSPLSRSPALWLKADAGAYTDAGTTLATTGQTSQQWNDQSGNGRHASQGTSASRPTFVTGVQNGLPVLRFDGSNDLMDTVFAAIPQPYTLFIVAKASDVSVSAARFVDTASASRALLGLAATTGLTQQFAGSTIMGASNRSGAFHQWTVLFNGASSLARVDGASEIAVSNAGSNGFANLRLGSDATDSVATRLNGDICEVILYPSDQTASFATIEAYLKARWGTP